MTIERMQIRSVTRHDHRQPCLRQFCAGRYFFRFSLARLAPNVHIQICKYEYELIRACSFLDAGRHAVCRSTPYNLFRSEISFSRGRWPNRRFHAQKLVYLLSSDINSMISFSDTDSATSMSSTSHAFAGLMKFSFFFSSSHSR